MEPTYLLLSLVFLGFTAWYLWWNRSALHVQAAQRAYRRGDEPGTLAAFAKAEAAGRLSADATASYAYLALKFGHLDEAAQVLERALASGRRGRPLKPGERRLLEVYHAMALWKQDRLDEAVNVLEDLLADGYQTTALYANLGYLLMVQKNRERAELVCLQAVDWDPEGKVILDNLAWLHLEKQEWSAAAEVYQRLLALEPQFPEAWYGAGLAALKTGDSLEARRRWEHALTLPFHALSTVEREQVERALAELPLVSPPPTN